MNERLAAYLTGIGAEPSALDGWTVKEAQHAGALAAFVIAKGPEIHFVPVEGKRGMSRRNIHEFLAPILAEFGYCTTRVPLAETNHKLRESLGFRLTWADASHTYWAMTELPYARQEKGETPCQ